MRYCKTMMKFFHQYLIFSLILFSNNIVLACNGNFAFNYIKFIVCSG